MVKGMKGPGKQQGVAIGLILGVVVLIAAIGAVLVSGGRQSSTNTATEVSKLDGAAIMTQGLNLRDGFVRMLTNGVDPATIEFDADAGTGLFHPTDGGAVQQLPPASVTGTWAIGSSVSIAGVGTGGPSIVAYVDNVPLGACEAINRQLFGAGNEAPLDATTAIAAAAGEVPAGVGTEGCINNDGSGNYAYYTVLLAG